MRWVAGIVNAVTSRAGSDSFYAGDQPVTVDGIVKSLPPAAIVTLQTDLETLMASLVRSYSLVREFLGPGSH